MKVTLDYGRTGLECDLPDANVAAVLRLNHRPPIDDLPNAIQSALCNPIGTAPLRELAAGKKRACIVVCDFTRPVPNPVLLPPILAELEAAGLPREAVTILIATGTHRPCTRAEIDEMLGEDVAHSCRVVNHVCTDADSLVDLGVSPNGVPVKLNREYVDADLRITVGLIEPHFMAGFSGGRKLVMPGIAALETVQAWHSPRFLEHPNASAGVVPQNPVHEETLAIVIATPPDMICDVTLDEEKRITGIFAGDLEEAWLAGVEAASQIAQAELAEPVDIAITTCAGYPLDATFYQAVKGMVGAMPALKPGGSIIIASECSEGVGNAHFKDALIETDDLSVYLQQIQQPDWKFVPDQWEVEELAKVTLQHKVYCIASGIPHEILSQCFVTPAATVEEAVEMALAHHGADATIAVIPRGPYVLPVIR
jgi:nickel-dependent lactate racemase